jgi:hypothetical protein
MSKTCHCGHARRQRGRHRTKGQTMMALLIAAVALWVTGAHAQAVPVTNAVKFMNNGQVVYLDVYPDRLIQFRFPVDNSIIFTGHWTGDRLDGAAFRPVFPCADWGMQRFAFVVSGGVQPDGTLRLEGEAPVVDKRLCVTTAQTEHFVLSFTNAKEALK